MMDGRCETCKWWGADIPLMHEAIPQDEHYEPEVSDQRYCALTFTYRGATAFSTKAESAGHPNGILYTRPDFGCIQWEPNE